MSEQATKLKVDESRLPGITVHSTDTDGVMFISRKSRRSSMDECLFVCPHCDLTTWASPAEELDWPEECLTALKNHRGRVPLCRCDVHGFTVFVGEDGCRSHERVHCRLVPL